ncbi:MAG: glycosyltransferase [Candidatus Hydrogenedentes bacterium]|nr:glycosyltransferase [Candidatus Hydrogenedentota bacterium]
MSEAEPSKPRVLLLHNFLAPYRVPLFAELATRFDLDVWILGNVRHVRDWPADAPGAPFRYRNVPHLTVPLTRYNALVLNYTLAAALARHRHDAIICCAWDTPATFYTACHARLTRTPFILWSGSTARESTRLRTLTKPAVRALVRGATAWLAYGTRAKDYLVSLGADPERTFRAFNTVETGWFAEACEAARPQVARLRERLDIAPDARVVVYCGNLLELKGVGDLLAGFAELARMREDVTLVLVGSGRGEAEYRSLVEAAGLGRRVVFAGFVPRPEVPAYYALADLLVLPSRSEVWGLVVNEALAAGVPVLATDAVGASEDLIQEGRNGYVVPARDPGALCGAMDRHLSDATDLEAMRAAARESIGPFTIARAADAFEQAVACALGRA